MIEEFKRGDRVSYYPVTPAGIRMEFTKIVGYNDNHQNNWTIKYTELGTERNSNSGVERPTRIEDGPIEKRYVIEHAYGWYPSSQKNLNPELRLRNGGFSRYSFAYESELKLL